MAIFVLEEIDYISNLNLESANEIDFDIYLAFQNNTLDTKNTSFILDSKTTIHICCNKSLFINLKQTNATIA